jgi:hypothetical protein
MIMSRAAAAVNMSQRSPSHTIIVLPIVNHTPHQPMREQMINKLSDRASHLMVAGLIASCKESQ